VRIIFLPYRERIKRQCDFNIGKVVLTLLNTRTRHSDPYSRQSLIENEGRMITWYGSLDGSIGKISPIGEKMYKRLQLLQTLMQTHMPHYAGLNPKEYRSVSK